MCIRDSTYTGRDMKTTHAGMGVTEKHFNALVEDLVKSLDKHKVPQKEQQELPVSYTHLDVYKRQGPNYSPFDPDIVYAIRIDNNHDAVEDLRFEFRFRKMCIRDSIQSWPNRVIVLNIEDKCFACSPPGPWSRFS